jgi:tetratricopeptide (TPR) repeat protein
MRDTTQPLSEERVAAWLHGELAADEHAEVEAAIDRDPQWLRVVALLARREGPRVSPAEVHDEIVAGVEREHAARLRPGAHVGRYEIEAPLGRGGMGVVYAARDPDLGRMVALKLLRSVDPQRQRRLLAEARALARLSDRHVITIYDTGTWQGRVFIAMELLVGKTLLAWRTGASPSWREVVRVFALAGRGLVAAHAAGLVHRDFKPANVVLTDDGRVIVLDFGLAIEGADEGDRSEHDVDRESTRTESGAGTPAYMAPEQRRGDPCDAQADQYGFCVALFEALHGELPVQTAPARHGPAQGRVPRSVERAIARGLAEDPRARHPSMLALCEALESAMQRRAPWGAIAIATGAIAIGALALGDRGADCTGAAAALAPTFDDVRAQEIRAAIEATDRPWSARVAEEVDAGLRGYADAWIGEHTAACEIREQGALDLRMRCLDRRRRSFAAVVDVLARADVEVAVHAVQTVDALPPVAGCRDLEALQATVAAPTDRAAVDALHDRLARVEALRETTRYDDAMIEARVAIAEAVALGHAPTEADARLAAAWVQVDLGEHEAAEAELRAALVAAQAGHHDEAIAIAFHRLAWVVGYKLARHDEGRELAAHAAAWIERLGGAPYHELARLRALGWIEQDAGVPLVALERFDAALAVANTLPDRDPFAAQEVALVMNGIGAAAHVAGDNVRASASFTDAVARLEARLGPDHPDVARVRNNLASVLRDAGKVEQAQALFVQNLAVFEAAHGAEHPVIGQTLVNLAIAEIDLGQDELAEQHATRAIEVFTAAHGSEHPLVAKALTIRADTRIQLDRPLEAIADLMTALDLETRTLGAEHPSVAIIESNLGGAYYALDRFDEAAQHQGRSLELLEKTLGAEHPNVGFVLVSLGLTRRDQGRLIEALALFDRAVTQASPTALPNALTRKGEVLILLERDADAVVVLERARELQAGIETDPALVGDTCFALAQVRWTTGRREDADVLANEALAAYEASGQPENAAAVQEWLAKRDTPGR